MYSVGESLESVYATSHFLHWRVSNGRLSAAESKRGMEVSSRKSIATTICQNPKSRNPTREHPAQQDSIRMQTPDSYAMQCSLAGDKRRKKVAELIVMQMLNEQELKRKAAQAKRRRGAGFSCLEERQW